MKTAQKIQDDRSHPDVFTSGEALAYLHLPADAERTLETFRDQGLLKGVSFGRVTIYHRAELDALVSEKFAFVHEAAAMANQKQPASGPRLRLGGGR